MAMEQRRAEILFERADLTADGGLAEPSVSPAWVNEPASAAA